MHEHMDEMGIINMNGRIYDPLIGRFMSADPYIQAPDDLQSFNRYAYVMNNPLNLDDPSGYFSISKLWKKVWKSPIFKAAVGILVAVYAPALLKAWLPSVFGASKLALALGTGALSGFASTGTLKGALTGALTAGIMFGVGEIGEALKLASGGAGKVALHAGADCISSMVGGGSCKAGAISGALGEAGLNLPDGGKILNTAKAAMLGGLGSKLAGGKFADGAQTGAFGYLFNELLHSGNREAAMKRAGYDDSRNTLGATMIDSDSPTNREFRMENRRNAAAAADTVSTLATYGAAGCVALCQPAVPLLTGVAIGADISKNLIFDVKPGTLAVDTLVDWVGDKLGAKLPAVGPVLRTYIKENIKDNPYVQSVKDYLNK